MSHHDEANLGSACGCAECVDRIKEREKEIDFNFAELEGRDWEDYDGLLRVARAAKVAFPDLRSWIEDELRGTTMYANADKNMKEWEQALKKVEHLL
jgi:hypothetical protein